MTTLSWVNLYVCVNILLLLAAVLLAGMRSISTRLQRPFAFRQQLQCGYAFSIAAALLPLIGLYSGKGEFLPNAAQVWSASTMQHAAGSAEIDRIAISVAQVTSVPLDTVSGLAGGLFLLGMAILIIRVTRDALATARVLSSAQVVRRNRGLTILASERIAVPFSFWLPSSSYIVVPVSLLSRVDDLRMAIRHEGQHHRHLDTRLLYLYQLLKACFFWNPAVHYLESRILELQEFACDEALIVHRKVSAQAYGHCLLRVAEGAVQSQRAVVCMSMIGGASSALVRRRIEAMLAQPTHYICKRTVVAACAAALVLMAATALAFTSSIHDRRVSMADANHMAEVARQTSAIPIVLNDRVLEQLNRYLGTPDGRDFVRASMERMRRHQAFISARIAHYGLPPELLAVPLVESGYRNRPQGQLGNGAGLWMFITTTAKRFGLKVDERTDERLDVAAETDAAMRMFAGLNAHFNDWGLALLAYNAGNAHVEKGIQETGSRDVWEITRRGYENDPDYVPRVMAAILILKNAANIEVTRH